MCVGGTFVPMVGASVTLVMLKAFFTGTAESSSDKVWPRAVLFVPF